MDDLLHILTNQTTESTISGNSYNVTEYLGGADFDEMENPDDIESFYYAGDLEELRRKFITTPQFVPIVSVYSITSILGIIGNSLVIFAMVGDRKSRSVTGSFMVSLAVADLLYLLVCVPYETAKFFTGNWASGAAMCKLSGLVEMLSPMTTVLNLLAVSVERYVVIVHPMNARSWCSVENTKKILPLVWAVAFALSCPCLYVFDTVEFRYHNNFTSVVISICADGVISDEHRLIFSSYQLVIMFIVPVFILTFCYVFVIHVLWASSRQLKEMTSYNPSSYTIMSNNDEANRQTTLNYNFAYEDHPEQSPATARHSHIRSRRSMLSRVTREHSAEVLRARKQVIKMLVAIVIVFMVCWGPKLTFALLQRFQMTWMHNEWALNMKIGIFVLPFVHSCLNPIVYGFMSRNFRSRLSSAFRSSICRKTHPKESTVGKKTIAGSYYELESRSTNGTVHTKISLRQGSSSNSET